MQLLLNVALSQEQRPAPLEGAGGVTAASCSLGTLELQAEPPARATVIPLMLLSVVAASC